MEAEWAQARNEFACGRGKLGWIDNVETQRKHIAVFYAVENMFGSPPLALAAAFMAHMERFPPPVRRMGNGYEPHVNDVAGRLVYFLPVDSSFVSVSFSFFICGSDLEVLRDDDNRRAVLEVVAHTMLQRFMIRGNPEVSEAEFAMIVQMILHSTTGDLERFIGSVDCNHNLRVRHYAEAVMQRRAEVTGSDTAGKP